MPVASGVKVPVTILSRVGLWLDTLDPLDPEDELSLDTLDWLDTLDRLDLLDWLDELDTLDTLDRVDFELEDRLLTESVLPEEVDWLDFELLDEDELTEELDDCSTGLSSGIMNVPTVLPSSRS